MNFKELMQNDKYKSAFKLTIYTILMAILILIVRLGNSNLPETNNENKKTALENLKTTNYQYDYVINYRDTIYNISGIRFNDEEIMTYDGKRYYLKDSEIYEIIDDKTSLTNTDTTIFKEIKSEKIYEAINGIKPAIELNIASILSKEYAIIYGVNLDPVTVTTYETDNYITKVEIKYVAIDLSITINYSNIGKVTELNTNFKE